MSIKVENITKLYGKQKALNNVSFEINTGDIVGFIGPNGAGKSTMMKIITGFLPPSSGKVLVNDVDVNENSLKVKANIGYLPEHNPLYLDMYVKEYLRFVGGVYKLKNLKTRVEEIIEKVGLTKEQNKKISALSKGYRQRVGIAQALIHNPKILILDEPTSGLDPNQIVEVRNLISEVGKDKTVMLSTHIMQEVEAICDKVIIVNNGEIVLNDNQQKISGYTNSDAQIITVEFNTKADINKMRKLVDVNNIKKVNDTNYILECKSDIRESIFNFAVENNLKVFSMQKKEKTLDEVFQELTGGK